MYFLSFVILTKKGVLILSTHLFADITNFLRFDGVLFWFRQGVCFVHKYRCLGRCNIQSVYEEVIKVVDGDGGIQVPSLK